VSKLTIKDIFDKLDLIQDRRDALRKEMRKLRRKSYREAEAAGYDVIALQMAITMISKKRNALKRRRRQRELMSKIRRVSGALPREEYEKNSLQQTMPWEIEQISRRTWFRRRRARLAQVR
jgi:hypothetical protein